METRYVVLSCAEYRERFTALLHDDLDAVWRERVKEHMLACEACTLAFGQVIATSQEQGHLPVPAVPPMPRPPVPVLEAMGVRRRDGSRVWTKLYALANSGIDWAKRELENVRGALQTTLEFLSLPQPAWGDLCVPGLGEVHTPEETRVEEVEVVDASGQRLGRKILFEVVTPPTVTTRGEFLLTMRTDVAALEGATLVCTVHAVEGVQVTFEQGLQREADNKGWQVTINAEGLPAWEEDVEIPDNDDYVSWSLRMG